MTLRISTWCAVALLAASSMQAVHAKRAPSRTQITTDASELGDALCDRGIKASGKATGEAGSLSDSRWLIKYKASGEPARSYALRLLPGGRLLNAHPNDQTPNNDRWSAQTKGGREYVTLRFNDSYAVYTGEVDASGDALSGTAVNRNADRWSWRATRLAACPNAAQ